MVFWSNTHKSGYCYSLAYPLNHLKKSSNEAIKWNYANFRELVSRLKGFMRNRGNLERIGPTSLIASNYFTDELRNRIATRISTLKRNYLSNIKKEDPSRRIMFELPDLENVIKVTVDCAAVKGISEPIVTYGKKSSTSVA